MSRKVQFKKQYKPIGFGDPPDPRTVEGHRNAVRERTEDRRADKMLEKMAAEDEMRRPTLFSKIWRFLDVVTSKSRRY
jgi:hypothetical protein